MLLSATKIKKSATKTSEVGNILITYSSIKESDIILYEVKTFQKQENKPNSVIQNNLFLTQDKYKALQKFDETVKSFT